MEQFVIEPCGYGHECAGSIALDTWGSLNDARKKVLAKVRGCSTAHEWRNMLCAHNGDGAFTPGPLFEFRGALEDKSLLPELWAFDRLTDFNRFLDEIRQREHWRKITSTDWFTRMRQKWIRALWYLQLPEGHMLFSLFTAIMDFLEQSNWWALTAREEKLFLSQIWAAQSIIGVYVRQVVEKVQPVQ